jgi:hypothetical protein
MLLKEKGASAEEIGAAIYGSTAWQQKHGEQSMQALSAEVSRVMSKE